VAGRSRIPARRYAALVHTIIHRSAALNTIEQNQLIAGMNATFAESPPIAGGGG
jgi:hypothetical protein